MAHHQHAEFGDQATKENEQEKLGRQLIAVLTGNPEALCHVTEIFQKLIEMQHTPEAQDVTAETLVTARNEEHTLMLAQRENDDSDRQNQHLMNDNAVKDKRLFQKEDKMEGLKELMGEIKTRDDELLAKIGEKEQELAQHVEKIKILEEAIEDQKAQIKALSANGGNDDLRAQIAEKETNPEQQAERIAELEMKLQAMAKENEERGKKLKELEEFHRSKDREIERLKTRVATLSERRVMQNQSKVEDTLSKNRQSKVEEDFYDFFGGTRMDVREKVEKSYSFKEQIEVDIYCPRLLCIVFEAAYETMEEARGAIFELGKEVTKGFIQLAPKEIKTMTSYKRTGISKTSITYQVCLGRQESQYPVEAVDALMMILKETAPSCNLDCLVEDVIQAAKRKWSRWQDKEKLVRNSQISHAVRQLHKPPFQEYIKASIQLTWRMVTQTPPLRLEYHSSHLQQCHKKMGYHMSPEVRTLVKGTPDQHQEEEIACYLWPGLFDGEGRCIRKGEVLCKIKGNTE